MTPRIHFFPLADPDSIRLFCGEFHEGDGWSRLPQAITCPECERRLMRVAPEARSAPVGAAVASVQKHS